MSSIKITVGGYEFSVANANAAEFSENRSARFGAFGQRIMTDVHWIIRPVFIRSTQAELTSALNDMVASIKASTQIDAIVYDNDLNETTHTLKNAETVNGVQLVSISYSPGNSGKWGMQTEYVNMRTVQIVLRASVLDYDNLTVSYHQSISLLANGGPDFVIQESLGFPVTQGTKLGTKSVIVQHGYAEGLLTTPSYPLPLYTGLKPRPFLQEPGTPKQFGINQHTVYPIRWRYQFESATPYVALPPPIFL